MNRYATLVLCGAASCVTARPADPGPPKALIAETTTPQVADPADFIDEVAAGLTSTCVRTKQGRIACWGDELILDGLDGGSRRPSWEPLVFPMPPASSLIVGEDMWCASTRGKGEVWCWGGNGHGDLGRQTASGFDMRPGPVPHVEGVVQLAHRSGKTCARTKAGPVWCWGNDQAPTRITATEYTGPLVLNDSGELCSQRPLRCDADDGASPFERKWAIVDPWYPGPDLLQHCSLEADGAVTCAKHRGYTSSLSFPLTQPGSLSVGESHACGLGMDGRAWCRGDDSSAQLGDMASLGAVRSVSAGARHSCALTESREVVCWGDNAYGQVGFPIRTRPGDVPVKASLDRPARGLVRFGRDICVETDGAIFCPSKRCEAPGFEATAFDRVVVGAHDKTCLYTPGGPSACANNTEVERGEHAEQAELERSTNRPDYGRWCVAKGRISPCDTPERLETDGTLSSVSTGFSDACGLTPSGDLRCYFGATKKMHTFPGPFAEVSVPDALARRESGSYVWIDRSEARLQPMPIPNLIDVNSEGSNNTCGVDENGVAWCWPVRREPEPQRIDAPVAFSKVEVTMRHACAIGEDSSLWCWGANDDGQLGWGAPRCARTPLNLTERILRKFEQAEGSR